MRQLDWDWTQNLTAPLLKWGRGTYLCVRALSGILEGVQSPIRFTKRLDPHRFAAVSFLDFLTGLGPGNMSFMGLRNRINWPCVCPKIVYSMSCCILFLSDTNTLRVSCILQGVAAAAETAAAAAPYKANLLRSRTCSSTTKLVFLAIFCGVFFLVARCCCCCSCCLSFDSLFMFVPKIKAKTFKRTKHACVPTYEVSTTSCVCVSLCTIYVCV